MKTRPNRHTLALLAILLTIWYAGAAQQNGTAYVLAFLLGSLLLVSYLHAKNHLRGIAVTVGSLPPVRKGQSLRLPLTLSVASGRNPTGLEITSPSAVAPAMVESVSPNHPTHVSLTLKPSEAGRQESVSVTLRSRFPLGFFTTEHSLQITKPHLVHPAPSGTLPLPGTRSDTHTGDATLPGATASQRSGGDDFNGVRPWASGDPLKHVDWRAVARGRPMMVKQFTGGSSPVVELKWSSVDLPVKERASQMAKWIDEADERGLRFSLELPDLFIKAGSGVDHRRRCLDALATILAEHDSTVSASQGTLPRRSGPTGEMSPAALGRPLALLAGTIAFIAVPAIGSVPWAGVIVFFLSLLLRWIRGRRGLLPMYLRLLIVAAGVAGVYAETGSLYGVEAGIAFLLILTAAKVLESRTPRDLQVLALMGWVLCLCGLVLEQNLTRAIFVVTGVLALTLGLVRLRRGTTGFWTPLKTTLLLTAQAVPLVVLLFFFFPRGTAGLVTSLTRSLQHQTGISDDLAAGSIAKVAESDAPAFRASVPGRELGPNEMYWRCLTLLQCDGLRWRKGPFTSALRSTRATGESIKQIISLEPHGGLWLPALDRPSKIVKGGRDQYIDDTEQVLRSHEPVRFSRRYEIESNNATGNMTLSQSLRLISLTVPKNVSQRVAALAEKFRSGGKTDEQIMAAALKHFETGGYSYTLQPGKYGADPLDEFLFDRKLGFCEHFAASFGTLMRLAGVPTRLVVGYLGGELFGDYYIVRQYNAHVWAEVFIEGKGWTRVDPTATLAPSRLSSDFRSLMADSFDVGFSLPRDAWWGRALLSVQIYWDNLNYQWFTKVVQFGEDEQYSLFSAWGLGSIKKLALTTLGLLAAFGLGLWWWIRRPARHPDPAVRAWEAACAGLARKGRGRSPEEAPLTYARRVPQILPLAEVYNRYRYGSVPVPLSDIKAAAALVKKQL